MGILCFICKARETSLDKLFTFLLHCCVSQNRIENCICSGKIFHFMFDGRTLESFVFTLLIANILFSANRKRIVQPFSRSKTGLEESKKKTSTYKHSFPNKVGRQSKEGKIPFRSSKKRSEMKNPFR